MNLSDSEKSDLVAEKAQETFEKIKSLRKTSPTKFKWQRNELEDQVKDLKAQWWDEVKGFMAKPGGIDGHS